VEILIRGIHVRANGAGVEVVLVHAVEERPSGTMDSSGRPEAEPPLAFTSPVDRRGGEKHPGIGEETGEFRKRL
jgi:hypothetical protein